MWIELAEELSEDCLFYEPAGENDLAAVEAALGVRLPPSLRGLLQETDGLSVRPESYE